MRLLFTLLSMCLFLVMCDTTDSEPKPTLTLTLTANGPEFSSDGNYPTQGEASDILTHWATWIEKDDGTYVRTIKVNTQVPTISKYGKDKLSSLPTWNTASNASNITSKDNLTSDNVYVEFDGLTAASLSCYGGATATATSSWDLSSVEDGTYSFKAEISTLEKNIASIDTITGDTTYLDSEYASRAQSTSGKVTITGGVATITELASPTTNILSFTASYSD